VFLLEFQPALIILRVCHQVKTATANGALHSGIRLDVAVMFKEFLPLSVPFSPEKPVNRGKRCAPTIPARQALLLWAYHSKKALVRWFHVFFWSREPAAGHRVTTHGRVPGVPTTDFSLNTRDRRQGISP
jgi:hypothetical protein